MYRIFRFYFLNYYHFFLGKNKNVNFAITRAINLIFLNLFFLLCIPISVFLKIYPEARSYLLVIKQYSIGFFVILILFLFLHWLVEKRLRKLIPNWDFSIVTKRNIVIAFSTIICILFVFLLVLFL